MEPAKKFEAVAIGASAGGVEALTQLLAALPAGFGLPVFIVIHMTPDRLSLLPQLFARRCALPVREVEDKEPIVPGTVYVAAPDYHMLVGPDKQLSLSRDEPLHFSRPSIDLLFESAAYAYRQNLLAIVLTGASNDGAAGLQCVREAGGSAWVQDPQDAKASIMPAAAIARAGADLIADIHQIAACLSVIQTGVATDRENEG